MSNNATALLGKIIMFKENIRDVSLTWRFAPPRKKKTNRTESKTIQVEFEFSLLGTKKNL